MNEEVLTIKVSFKWLNSLSKVGNVDVLPISISAVSDIGCDCFIIAANFGFRRCLVCLSVCLLAG